MHKAVIPSIVLLVLIGAVVGAITMIFHNIHIGRSEVIDQRWAQVNTVMQRRLDLIPNLVETVKGYASHEQETLVKVMDARTTMAKQLTAAGRKAPRAETDLQGIRQASATLSSSLGRLFALVENYPNLKASQNFLTLQDQLEGTENRISVERKRYNDAVMTYNRGIKRFPGNLAAAFFGFEQRAYFEAAPEAVQPVQVKF